MPTKPTYNLDLFGLPYEALGTLHEGWSLAEKRSKASLDQIAAAGEELMPGLQLVVDFLQVAALATHFALFDDNDHVDDAPVPHRLLALPHNFEFYGADGIVAQVWVEVGGDNHYAINGMPSIKSVPLYSASTPIHRSINDNLIRMHPRICHITEQLEKQRLRRNLAVKRVQVSETITHALEQLINHHTPDDTKGP